MTSALIAADFLILLIEMHGRPNQLPQAIYFFNQDFVPSLAVDTSSKLVHPLS
jgi:hypothetical protein